MFAIEHNEAKERDIHNISDFMRLQPGRLDEIKTWFRDYKTWEGGKPNKFL